MGGVVSSVINPYSIYAEGFDPKMPASKVHRNLVSKWGVLCTKVSKETNSSGAVIYFDSQEDLDDSRDRLQEVRIGNHSLRFKQVRKTVKDTKLEMLLEANMEKIIDRDDNLVTPWNNVDYDEQIAQKSIILVRLLSEMFDAHYPTVSVIRSTKSKEYNNKCRFAVGYDINNIPAVGFMTGTKHNNYIIPLKFCEAFVRPIGVTAKRFLSFMIANNSLPFSSKTGMGIWKSLLVRSSDQGILVAAEATKTPSDRDIDRLIKSFPDVALYLKVKQTFTHLGGPETIEIAGFVVGPTTPYPINEGAMSLFVKALSNDTFLRGRIVIDIYCGCGTTILGLTDVAKKIIGIEANRPAAEEAQNAINAAGIGNVQIIAGTVENEINKTLSDPENPPDETTVLLEPPASGSLKRVFIAVRDGRPSAIAFRSSSLEAHSSEIRTLLLHNDGYISYRYNSCIAVDFCPGTEKTEAVVFFKRVDK